MTSPGIVRYVLAVMIAALVGATWYTSAMIRERQAALESVFRYNVAYTASQAVIEFGRFVETLLLFDRQRSEANLQEAQLRYEILYNRAAVFDAGEFESFLLQDADRIRIHRDFREAIQAVDPLMTSAGTGLQVEAVLAHLLPLQQGIIGLASEANRYGADLIASDQRDLADLQSRFSTLTFGLIASCLSLVLLLSWHNKLVLRARDKLHRTTVDLEFSAAQLSEAHAELADVNRELRDQNHLLLEKEDALRSQNALFDTALNNMAHGLCMFDSELRPLVFNSQFQQLFPCPGVPAGEPPCAAGNIAATPLTLHAIAPDIAPALAGNVERFQAASFEIECGDGRIIAVAQQPMREGGWVATLQDVTEQHRTQERIAHMARHDGLTNLPNRYAFRERLQGELERSADSGGMLAVMCLDLDHFKEVNDTLGHPSGDFLLCAAAERLLACLRETDMVARFGGDEFAVLQPRIRCAGEAEQLAARLVAEMSRPFQVGAEVVYVTGSVGIAISPVHGEAADTLLKNADLALYAAKGGGRRGYSLFEPQMDARITHRHNLARDLRGALQRHELSLDYQPLVDLSTMRVTGLEALLRWAHPTRGAIAPCEFIPVAEDAGLIGDIGRWVLREACADAAAWPGDLKVSVNLSPAQFDLGDVAVDIAEALNHARLQAGRLVVEITESLLLGERRNTVETLRRLKSLGVQVAMDDFGTGYSSLSYLRKYPFDAIKIDRAFVDAVGKGEENAAIIRTIVQLGTSLGMRTVAEGVETEAQLEMLLEAGCAEGQGYLFSRPVPRDKVAELLATHGRAYSKVA